MTDRAHAAAPEAAADSGAAAASLDLSILEEEVLRFLGYPEGRRPAGRLVSLLGEALREARGLARGRGAYRMLPVSAAPDLGLELERADGLVIGLVTVGDGIERRVTELLGQGEESRALLLDAAGSAAAEEAARRLSTRIVGGGAIAEADVSCRVSPGYGRWPLAAQAALFARLPHEELGVTLGPSMMMSPRKSISFALWIGAEGIPGSGLAGCDRCGLPSCRYREATTSREAARQVPARGGEG